MGIRNECMKLKTQMETIRHRSKINISHLTVYKLNFVTDMKDENAASHIYSCGLKPS